LHVICPNVQILDLLVKSLTRLYHARLDLVGGLSDMGTAVEERIWQESAAKSRNAIDDRQMSFAELEALCKKLSFHAPASHLKQLFRQVDVMQRGSLTFDEFKQFVDLLKARNDIAAIYAEHTKSSMRKDEFFAFLTNVQGQHLEAEESERMWERIAGDEQDLSLARFTTYLQSRQNSILKDIPQDMSRPLNEYFISSSHNTYLTGWQIGDEASVEPYIRALQRGCRCIEIDIWSDSNGMPEVRHGHSFTTPVSLESVLRAIEKYAFIVSPWPLIISIELRCSIKAQEVVVNMLQNILGDALAVSRYAQLPSPNDLRYRILLKVKASHGITEDPALPALCDSFSDISSAFDDLSTTESEYSQRSQSRSRTSSHSSHSSSVSSQRGSNAATTPALLQLAPLMQGIKFRNFSLPESKSFNHIFSLSERHIRNIAQASLETRRQILKHNARYLMRIYPSATRVRSTNFAPQEYWQQGVQMVALNWQTHDVGMQLNDAMFAACGSNEVSGYRLKPASMRIWRKGQTGYLDAPEHTQPRRQWRVTVLSGTQLPKSSANARSSPYVEVQVLRPSREVAIELQQHGFASAADRDIRFRTSLVDDNTFNPHFWHAPFQFVQDADDMDCLTFLRFLVHDVPYSGSSNETNARSRASSDACRKPYHLHALPALPGSLQSSSTVSSIESNEEEGAKNQPTGPIVATWACSLEDVQRGYRVVKLRDLSGEQFIFSSLLVRIDSTDI
jgi:phosphatidylinositol phospholipase C delta